MTEAVVARRWPVAALQVCLAAGLVIFAEALIFDREIGWVVGLFNLIWLAAAAATRPGVWRNRTSQVALGVAAFLGLVQIDSIGPLSLVLFWVALSVAVIAPIAGRFDDALRWTQRLVLHGLVSLFGPLIDSVWAWRALPPGQARRLAGRSPLLLLPILGGVIFLALFAAANPILAELLARVRWPLLDELFFPRLVFGAFVVVLVWGGLRPRVLEPFLTVPEGVGGKGLPASVLVRSLAVFNAVFALENGLDIAFLWSGAALPANVTFADYAHRGAYTLILTALLAAAFVLVALRPGSAGAGDGWVRGLVILWTVQNLVLVASSMLRTWDYVEAYGLTRLRIAALVWMLLVAIGLALICWRLLRGLSAAWLVNANALTLAAALLASSVVDYGALAAAWNVRHARELGTGAARLDLCYLEQLGDKALVSLVALETLVADPVYREAVASVRQRVMIRTWARQDSGTGWTWRNARRLDRVQAQSEGRLPGPAVVRDCRLRPQATASAPLTSSPKG